MFNPKIPNCYKYNLTENPLFYLIILPVVMILIVVVEMHL